MSNNPSDYCNWIIKDQILVGGYPYPKPEYRPTHLDRLIAAKVNVFISLVEQHEIDKFGDYNKLLLSNMKGIIYHNVPIKDRSITEDEVILNLVKNVYNWIQNGKLVYVHCWGGHGRTGTVVSCFLQYVYGMNAEDALKWNRSLHATRKYNSHKPTPQGTKQYAQVRRFQKYLTN